MLYVDDDPEFADLVAYWLREDDGDPPLSVRVAAGTTEALKTLAREPVDCVVSDYAMPDRDGIELLESLRERQTALPFILFTAHGGEETARDAFRAGVTDYMPKGGDRETVGLLAERIRAAVRDRRRTGEPRDHVQYRAGVREVTLDAATSLMSATPDELDAKIRFTLESLCEYMSLRGAATYRTTQDAYERRHTHGDHALPEVLDAREAWLGRLEAFETVSYGPDGAHPHAEETPGPTNHSGVAAPMISGWQLEGAVVFDASPDRVWSDEEVRLLETVTTLTARSMERREQARELRRQNERLEQFASVVSHDIRNPLNVATGWLDLAREGNDEAFDRVENALGRMEQLTEDVLTLARDGADVGETERVTVTSVARRAWERVDTDEASLTVEPVGEVEADESRLASVFENLFRNSVEHGGSDVRVTVGPTDRGFYVADDGPGLPSEEALFEWGTTTESDGSGLGLAIVGRVAEGHGWDVSTHDDDGARFEFVV